MTGRRVAPLVLWLAFLAVGAYVALHARITADLSAFLPAHPTAAQQVLVDQLKDGLTSRLVLVAIGGGDADARARASTALADGLRASGLFTSVSNGAGATSAADREFVFRNRYVLSQQVTAARFSVDGLRDAIGESIDSLAGPAGLLAKDLLPADPTGETLAVLDQLVPRDGPRLEGGVFASRDGREALLVATTRAAGSDTDGQERAIGLIGSQFSALGTGTAALRLTMSGPGVFASRARATIIHEAVRLSILSSLLVVALLCAVYRSAGTVLLGLLPVATGALAGATAVALGFGVVHGITLGFGVTLIGESVDYSIYLLVQARGGSEGNATEAWVRRMWPTVRLGLLTSLCGFASLLPSGFPGLAQLGLYSMAGLVAAALVTRFVLPVLLPARWSARSVVGFGHAAATLLARATRARAILWIVPLAAAAVVVFHRGDVWNRDLSALSPVPAADQALDARLRSSLGAPDVRDLVVIEAPGREAALQAAEAAGRALEPLIAAGEIAGYESPSKFLPSQALQRARQAALPDAATLRERLAAALEPLPLKAARLEPFVAAVEAARTAPLLEADSLKGTSVAAGFDALITVRDGQATAFLPLTAPAAGPHPLSIDAARIRAALGASSAGVTTLLIDLKQETDALYAGYLGEALRASAIGFAAIVLLVFLSTRSARRTARVIAPLLLAVLLVVAGLLASGCSLTILHLVGLLLIVAVGSNYALFFDRREASDPTSHATTLASLLVANLATVLGFGILAFSTVPVLSALGTTVAPGALAALLFSALMADPVRTS